MYIIKKTGTIVRDNISYSGKVWDNASLRHLYEEKYSSRKDAEEIAEVLSMWNPTGFSVSRVI